MANVYTVTTNTGTVTVVADTFALSADGSTIIFQSVLSTQPGTTPAYIGTVLYKLANVTNLVVSSPAPPNFTNVAFLNAAQTFSATQTFGEADVAHLVGAGSAPTVVVTESAGSGATVSLAAGATDLRGEIVLVTGSVPSPGTVVTLTFAAAFATAHGVPLVTSGGPETAAVMVSAQVNATMTTTTLLVNCGGSLAASTTYHFYYAVLG